MQAVNVGFECYGRTIRSLQVDVLPSLAATYQRD
jgi:hypothetical protein